MAEQATAIIRITNKREQKNGEMYVERFRLCVLNILQEKHLNNIFVCTYVYY